ncbi:MAG TPA: sigma 54-interacting transcriptional regulator [Thermoanaerobaculia bacterium]|jgi:formate hydrogenlyase transcriptional activator|nr:sigma 54-interacting transcriptional regulator [Thermoanaerobaculia bacterium]
MKEAPSPPFPPRLASEQLTAEDKYRLLLEVSEAANSQLDLAAVLEAVAHALAPSIYVGGVGVATVDGDFLVPHSIYIEGVERREGDSFADVVARWLHIPADQMGPNWKPPVPLAGSGTDYVGRTGKAYVCEDLTQGSRFPEDARLLAAGVHSYVRVPLQMRERLVGSMSFSRETSGPFPPHEVAIFEAVARPIAAAVANALAFEEISRLTRQLQDENLALRQEIDERSMFEEIVGVSKALRDTLARVDKVAATDATVLLTGETGTGKELVARAIHRHSPRAKRALVAVNCAALPASLIASELFGHEKGAFTGALQRRIGRFELAAGGSIFLDEVGELPPEVQATLLRVLQEGTFERVGGSQTVATDARVIAATNRDLSAAVAAGTFRSDLFYRLNVFPIEIPPLRQRREDLPILVEYFVARYAARLGKRFESIEKSSMDRILAYSWPGNVRELQNVIERATILSEGAVLRVDEPLIGGGGPASPAGLPLPEGLRELERRQIEEALAQARGRVSGAKGAAAILGVPATTLESRIKRLGIDKRRL